jgi:general stress protein 26
MKGTLPWSHVVERMAAPRNYWVTTVQPNGRPHAVPVWGVWVENTLYFGGSAQTRWSRNLAENPQAAVHLDSSDDVIILEGIVTRITDAKDPQAKKVDAAYKAKYKMPHGVPFWVLRPQVVYAWTQVLHDMTRWTFTEQSS